MKEVKRVISSMLILIILVSPYSKVDASSSLFKETTVQKFGEDKVHTYIHKNSTIKVMWIENKDINKGFTLGVKTPTTTSTGVNHIIEHTLFTGSRDYPSSSVFFDASEAYPSTYMNALTSSDMTMFPFLTPYESCYKELLHVYLDAIFKPDFLNQPYGFYEEGFYKSPKEDIVGGVVYNEMKGAYASTERAIFRGIRKAVLENTSYEHDSGGNPLEIPKLTYEEFVDTYNRYYHPNNMCVVFYGDLDIKYALKELDGYVGEYIDDFTKLNDGKLYDLEDVDLSSVDINQNLKNTINVLPQNSDGCIVKSFVFKTHLTPEQENELDLWMRAYFMNPKIGVYDKLCKCGLGGSTWMKDNELPCSIYSLIIPNVGEESMNAIDDKVDKILGFFPRYTMKDNFIERDVIDEIKWGVYNEDNSETRGVDIAQTVLDGWAHKKPLMQYYIKKSHIDSLKEDYELSSSVYENFIVNTQCYTTYLKVGKISLGETENISHISEDDWNRYSLEMKDWQLKRCDMKETQTKDFEILPKVETKVTQLENHKQLLTIIDGKIARSNLYINTSSINQADLPYLYIYSYLLEESASEITPFCGRINTSCIAYQEDNKDNYSPYLKIGIVTRTNEINHPAILSQARSYLKSKPNEWYRDKLIGMVCGMKESSERDAIGNLAHLNMASNEGADRYLFEQSYPLYSFCKQLLSDEKLTWIENIEKIDQGLYTGNEYIVGLATPKRQSSKYSNIWKKYLADTQEAQTNHQKYVFDKLPSESLVKTNSPVDQSYISLVKSEEIDGIDYIAASYLTKHYLTPKIRVERGAYGAGCQVSYPNKIGIYTYRDPQAPQSMEIAKKSWDYICDNGREMKIEVTKADALNKFQTQFRLLGSNLEQAGVNESIILSGGDIKMLINIQRQIIDANISELINRAKYYKSIGNNSKHAIMTQKKYIFDKTFTTYKY